MKYGPKIWKQVQNILGTRYENFFLPGTMWADLWSSAAKMKTMGKGLKWLTSLQPAACHCQPVIALGERVFQGLFLNTLTKNSAELKMHHLPPYNCYKVDRSKASRINHNDSQLRRSVGQDLGKFSSRSLTQNTKPPLSLPLLLPRDPTSVRPSAARK